MVQKGVRKGRPSRSRRLLSSRDGSSGRWSILPSWGEASPLLNRTRLVKVALGERLGVALSARASLPKAVCIVYEKRPFCGHFNADIWYIESA